MRYCGPKYFDEKGQVALVPWDDAMHLPYLLDRLDANPWTLDDKYGDPSAFFNFMLRAIDAHFFGVEVDGQLRGVVYASELRPGHRVWLHGYGDPQHPSIPARAFNLLADYAFRRWRVDVVHTEHCVANRGATAVLTRAKWPHKIVIPLEHSYQGQHYDAVMFSLTREEWHGRR
jgi:RimJ/RimL family protein N-acetyltransferase